MCDTAIEVGCISYRTFGAVDVEGCYDKYVERQPWKQNALELRHEEKQAAFDESLKSCSN